MRTNEAGIEIIKTFEGLRLRAYKCPAGKWTIGYGHTGPDVHPGLEITKERAEELLRQDLLRFENQVMFLVTIPINENQFSALVSFTYNVGADIDEDTIPEGLGDSTLLKLLNKGDFQGAANQFPLWCKSKGKILPGLAKRRVAERKLFLKEVDQSGQEEVRR